MSVELRILTADEIRRLLPMSDCIDLMQQTMIAVSAGKALLPLRSLMAMPGNIGALGIMPGYLSTADLYGTKLVSLIPRNAGTEHSSHIGMLVLFETEHGYPVALLDAAELTAIRTAAASGMATRLLARADASRLAILGTGEQARRHIEAMLAIRPISDIRIWGRCKDKARALAEVCGHRYRVAARPIDEVRQAVAEADIVCTVTHAADPILRGEWIGPGAHLNIVGSSIATTAEIDGDLVVKSRFFVDYLESALAQAGEYRRAIEAGLIGPAHILGEIGKVADCSLPGRTRHSDITLYKSLGIAAQDIAAGRFVLDRATHENAGQLVKS